MLAFVQHILGGWWGRSWRFGGETVPSGRRRSGGDLGGEPVLFRSFHTHLLFNKLEKLFSQLQVNVPFTSHKSIWTNPVWGEESWRKSEAQMIWRRSCLLTPLPTRGPLTKPSPVIQWSPWNVSKSGWQMCTFYACFGELIGKGNGEMTGKGRRPN